MRRDGSLVSATRFRIVRVGFFIRSLGPGAGGGYTLEHEVVQALIRARSGSRHEFVLVGMSPVAPPDWPGTYVSLHRSKAQRIRRRVSDAFPLRILRWGRA